MSRLTLTRDLAGKNVEVCHAYAVSLLGEATTVRLALELMRCDSCAVMARETLDGAALALERRQKGPALRAVDLYQSACRTLLAVERQVEAERCLRIFDGVYAIGGGGA